MKASVPKLFNCPGATKLLLTPSQEIGWLVIAASRDRLMNLQHRGIAPSWSRKSPQTHQDFRLKRFGLRARLSAPAQVQKYNTTTPGRNRDPSGLHQSLSPREETRQMSP